MSDQPTSMSNGTTNTSTQTTSISNGTINMTHGTTNTPIPPQNPNTTAATPNHLTVAFPHTHHHAQHHPAIPPSPPPTDDENSSSDSASDSESPSTIPPPMTAFQHHFSAARHTAIQRVQSVQRGGIDGRCREGQGTGGRGEQHQGGRGRGVVLPGRLRDPLEFEWVGGEEKRKGGRGGKGV